MGIVRFVLEIEDVDDEDFNITETEADFYLAEFEDTLAKNDYTIHDTRIERE